MEGPDFKLSDLIKPGQGSRQALQSALEERKARDDKRFKWEPGYVYSGAADLLLRHGEWFSGRQLPDEYEQGAPQRCFFNALETAEQHDIRYYQGLYMVGSRALAHAWCVDDEGLVEVTLPTKPHPSGLPYHWKPVGGTGAIPWTPPNTWAYVGVELDPTWVRAFIDNTDGNEFSILDPRRQDAAAEGPPYDDWIFRVPYQRGGHDLPPYEPPPEPTYDEVFDEVYDENAIREEVYGDAGEEA